MGKKHTGRYIAIAAVSIIAVLAIVVLNPSLDDLQGDNSGSGDGIFGTPSTPTVGGTYEGPVVYRFPVYDTQEATLEYGEDTEVDSILFSENGQRLGAPSGSSLPYTATVTASPSVQTIWIQTEVSSGQDYYLDVAAMKTANSGVLTGEPKWQDLDADGRNEWTFPVSVSFPAGTDPAAAQRDFNIALLDEGSIALDSPTDITTSTTGKQKCSIKWSADMDNDGDGEVLTRLRLTINSTDPNGWYPNDNNIKVPNTNPANPDDAKKTLYLSEAMDLELASTYRYDFDFGTGDVNEGLMLISPLNGEQEFEIPVEFWMNQDVIDNTEVTLEAQTVDAFGVYTTDSDAVACGESP